MSAERILVVDDEEAIREIVCSMLTNAGHQTRQASSGLKALENAGLMNAFKQHYRPGADQMRITDEQATIFYDQHTEENAAGYE